MANGMYQTKEVSGKMPFELLIARICSKAFFPGICALKTYFDAVCALGKCFVPGDTEAQSEPAAGVSQHERAASIS